MTQQVLGVDLGELVCLGVAGWREPTSGVPTVGAVFVAEADDQVVAVARRSDLSDLSRAGSDASASGVVEPEPTWGRLGLVGQQRCAEFMEALAHTAWVADQLGHNPDQATDRVQTALAVGNPSRSVRGMLATLRTLGVGVSGVAVMPLGATPLPQAAASDGITAVDTTQPSPDFGGVEAGL